MKQALGTVKCLVSIHSPNYKAFCPRFRQNKRRGPERSSAATKVTRGDVVDLGGPAAGAIPLLWRLSRYRWD